jgi:hypothetical protein
MAIEQSDGTTRFDKFVRRGDASDAAADNRDALR